MFMEIGHCSRDVGRCSADVQLPSDSDSEYSDSDYSDSKYSDSEYSESEYSENSENDSETVVSQNCNSAKFVGACEVTSKEQS